MVLVSRKSERELGIVAVFPFLVGMGREQFYCAGLLY
jgi:hypothetical protein